MTQPTTAAVRTPITKVVIQFGGLCMLVARNSAPTGLFVLMPRGHGHCPVLNCDSQYLVSGDPSQTFPVAGEVDLSNLANHGTSQAPFADDVAFVSHYADNDKLDGDGTPAPVPVDEQWFTTNQFDVCLAARIRLPLGLTLTFCGERARMFVPNQKHGKPKPAGLFGQVGLEITLTQQVQTLRVANVDLKPDAGGTVRFALLNVRPQDMQAGRRYNHDLMAHAHHLDAFYTLLEPADQWCGRKRRGPPILIGKKVTRNLNDDDQDQECGNVPFVALGDCPPSASSPGGVSFIDPYNCTIGGGCITGGC